MMSKKVAANFNNYVSNKYVKNLTKPQEGSEPQEEWSQEHERVLNEAEAAKKAVSSNTKEKEIDISRSQSTLQNTQVVVNAVGSSNSSNSSGGGSGGGSSNSNDGLTATVDIANNTTLEASSQELLSAEETKAVDTFALTSLQFSESEEEIKTIFGKYSM